MMKRLIKIVNDDLMQLNASIAPKRLIVNIREGFEDEFPNHRDYAYTYIDENGEYIIVYSKKMYQASEPSIQALMRHEMGHALHFLNDNDDHSEQETDDLAEQTWGDRIYYDEHDIQTLEYGKYPRPPYLHQ